MLPNLGELSAIIAPDDTSVSVIAPARPFLAIGEHIAMHGNAGLESIATVAEVAGDVVRILGSPLGGEGTALDAAWVAGGRLLHAPAVVLDAHAGGAWVGIGSCTVVAGRWLRRAVPAGVTATLHLAGLLAPPRALRSATVRDIGIGGVGIVVHDLVEPGESGVIELIDVVGRPLGELALVVVHVIPSARGTQAGCRFLSLLDGARIVAAVESSGA